MIPRNIRRDDQLRREHRGLECFDEPVAAEDDGEADVQ